MKTQDRYHEAIYEQLKTLRDFTAIINSTLDLEDLMKIVMEKAKAEMQAEACSILFYNRNTKKLEFEVALCNDESTCEILKEKIYIELGQGIAGWVALHQEPIYVEDVQKDSRFFKGADQATGFVTKSIIAFPLIGRRGLIGVAEIINPARRDYDKDIFVALCKQFAIAIENALLFKESLERERLKQELEIASSIQKSFLPEQPFFNRGDYTVRAINIPAYAIGGDIYDFVELSNDRFGVLIGDISGKGISAALYMAKAISDFRHVSLKYDTVSGTMEAMNAIIANAPRGIFLTSIYMIFPINGPLIEYVNAGHLPMIHIDKSGKVKVIEYVSGPPLGIVPMSYTASEIMLNGAERLILLTDGVIDAKDKKGRHLGFEEVVSFIKKNHKAERLIDMLADFANHIAEGQQRVDDITIMEVKRR